MKKSSNEVFLLLPPLRKEYDFRSLFRTASKVHSGTELDEKLHLAMISSFTFEYSKDFFLFQFI